MATDSPTEDVLAVFGEDDVILTVGELSVLTRRPESEVVPVLASLVQSGVLSYTEGARELYFGRFRKA